MQTLQPVTDINEPPLLFLDIDGVLNSFEHKALQNGLYGISPYHIRYLNEIVKETNPYIVLSSTWRKFDLLEDIQEKMRKAGFIGSLHSATPQGRGVKKHWPDTKERRATRGNEITEWMYLNGRVDCIQQGGFAILDDDSDMGGLIPNLVKTSYKTGLQEEHVEKAIALMKGE